MKQIIATNFFHLIFIGLLTAKIMNCNISWLAVFQPLIIEISLVLGYAACEYNNKNKQN
jgi:hypothetical protein